jgi:hypothetical protein
LFVAVTIRLNEKLRHGDGGSYRSVLRMIQPLEDGVGEEDVAEIGFQLINEDTGVQRDPGVAPKKGAELG